MWLQGKAKNRGGVVNAHFFVLHDPLYPFTHIHTYGKYVEGGGAWEAAKLCLRLQLQCSDAGLLAIYDDETP